MELEQYLYEVFKEKINIKKIDNLDCFPQYLLNFFDFYQCILRNEKYILLYLKSNKIIIDRIKKQFIQIESITKCKAVLVVNNVRRETRNNMIAHNIPFIDLNKQIYLPTVYLLLDDTIKFNNSSVDKFTPSAQLIFISLMYQDHAEVNSAELQKKLHLTAMTISRGLRDLHSLKLLNEKGFNTKKTYQIINKQDFWQIGKVYLINPVFKKFHVEHINKFNDLLYSNESALANLTMMNPPSKEIYAIDKKNNSFLRKEQIFDAEIAENLNCYTIELWKYNPLLLSKDGKNVDKYSLYAQLKDSHDERIEIELEELIER